MPFSIFCVHFRLWQCENTEIKSRFVGVTVNQRLPLVVADSYSLSAEQLHAKQCEDENEEEEQKEK